MNQDRELVPWAGSLSEKSCVCLEIGAKEMHVNRFFFFLWSPLAPVQARRMHGFAPISRMDAISSDGSTFAIAEKRVSIRPFVEEIVP